MGEWDQLLQGLPDPYGGLRTAILDTLLMYQGVLVPVGRSLYDAFAVILLVWFGLQTALGAGGRGGVPLASFVQLMLWLAFGSALITYYDQPIPGIGYSLPSLIIGQVAWLTAFVHTSSIVELTRVLDDIWTNAETPPLYDLVAAFVFVLFGMQVGLMKFAVFFVISFGHIAMAILIVLGPLFVPFIIVPHLDFLFWAWLRSFLTYSFYQIVGEIYVAVWVSFLLRWLDPFRAGVDLDQLTTLFTFMGMIFLAFVFGMLKIPSLAASLIAGRGGESTAGTTIGAAAVAGRVLWKAAK